MKTKTIGLLPFFCLSVAYAGNLNSTTEDSPLDITVNGNWNANPAANVTSIINNSYGYIASDQTFYGLRFRVEGNSAAGFEMTGTNSQIITSSSDAYAGSIGQAANTQTANGVTYFNILGNSNTYQASHSQGFIIGNVFSTTGSTTFYLNSDSMEAEKANKFTFTGGTFSMNMNASSASTAKNTMRIGNNSQVSIGNTVYMAGKAQAARGGENAIVMDGNGSKFTTTGTLVAGVIEGVTMTSGKIYVDISGANNVFEIQSNFRLGDLSVLNDATNSLIVRGSGNTFSVANNTAIGHASNVAGAASITLSGTNNTISLNTATLIKAGVDISGAGSILTASGAVTASNNTTIKVSAGGSLSIAGAFTLDSTSTLELMANSTGFLDGLGVQLADFTLEGILILDFANYSDTNDRVAVMSISGDTSSIQAAIDSGSIVLNNVTMNTDGLYIDNGVLYAHIVAVPEPAVYASILGALAIAFAAYRRRHK